jgi:hypothetical protein
VAADSRAFHQTHNLGDAFLVSVVAEIEADDDRGLRVSGRYSASFSPSEIGRDGTTVEMACL